MPHLGLEVFFGAGTLVLLLALIYGTAQYRARNRRATVAGEQVVRDRYKRNET